MEENEIYRRFSPLRFSKSDYLAALAASSSCARSWHGQRNSRKRSTSMRSS